MADIPANLPERRAANPHDFERTIMLGERSIGYLKQFRTPAIPRNYELFYVHSAGYNQELSQAIRKAIATHSCLTEEDAERLYKTYVQPKQYSEQVGEVGNMISREIKDILTSITSASHRTGTFGTSLHTYTDRLEKVRTTGELRDVVRELVTVTNEMSDYNRDLEMRLAESKRQIEDLHQTLETIRAESLTDQLTGLSNRKRFDQILDIELNEAESSREPLCLMLLDIDHFKSFNDTFGHQTGDQVLRLVAHTMKTNVKGRDHTARYGGEEFAILLPKTSLTAAVTVAEHIRGAIRGKELIKKSTGESLGHITMSVGISSYHPGEQAEELVHRADACLYAAKKAGRDCVKSETDPGISLDIQAA